MPSELCIFCDSGGTHQWISQQTTMMEPCFVFLDTLPLSPNSFVARGKIDTKTAFISFCDYCHLQHAKGQFLKLEPQIKQPKKGVMR